ncbi:hypothetical protein I551_0519 [Mycobacterium ulcerans str. Harvey]|uniref:Uncharacterized protein n=1 Tax=Mycobacterium ulcerans str. Harvey TaxID=1299332 RepID=A0ABN0R783_MYCUL|nr:hypothetical protein I551_0519 [Mycobacterium ulcerans str. Harvey]
MSAYRPGSAALSGQDALGDRDLLFATGQLRGWRIFAATVGGPGALRELDAAVVAVAGVDRPVAARLATGHLVPFAVGGRGRVAGKGDTTAAEHRAVKAILATLTFEVVGLR